MPGERVVVVGAGIGGLAAAAVLAARGVAVDVVEAAAAPGGKMREIEVAGRSIDSGPTVLTMRWVFDELFAEAGADFAADVPLTRADILARHAWGDGSRLDLFLDRARSEAAVEAFAGADEARRFRAFGRAAEAIFAALEGPFIRSQKPGLLEMPVALGPRAAATLARHRFFLSMARTLKRHFRDPRLVQLFGRYATYCGSSPYRAPALLMLVSHVESRGVWYVDGGMHRLARGLEALARRHGAQFRYAAPVDEILVESGRAAGVRLAGGERIRADAVVFNGDVSALGTGLLGFPARGAARPVGPDDRSLSAVTWSAVAETRGLELVRHTVVFSDDYAREFAEIGAGRLPSDPTVYICAQDRTDGPGAVRDGAPERLFLLVNAPALGDRTPLPPSEIERCREASLSRLARAGLTVRMTPDRTATTTPSDFDRLFPATGGALYGRANHGLMASFLRPGARSRIPGLYLAGGSVHPGPGIPMAALSGRQAAGSILADWSRTFWRSTARSRPAVISGGISTP